MKVLFFGIARDIVGLPALTLHADGGLPGTVGQLKLWLVGAYPEFGKLTSMAIAVNGEYALETDPLGKNDEIAVIPPVSGG